MSNILRKTLSANAYGTYNKQIAKEIGLIESILLMDLISKYDYFANNHLLEKDGSFFNTQENIKNDTTVSYRQQTEAFRVLIDYGFVKVIKKGVPAKNYFYIQFDKIEAFLNRDDNPTTVKESDINPKKDGSGMTSHAENAGLVTTNPLDKPQQNGGTINNLNNKLNNKNKFKAATTSDDSLFQNFVKIYESEYCLYPKPFCHDAIKKVLEKYKPKPPELESAIKYSNRIEFILDRLIYVCDIAKRPKTTPPKRKTDREAFIKAEYSTPEEDAVYVERKLREMGLSTGVKA